MTPPPSFLGQYMQKYETIETFAPTLLEIYH